MNNTKLVNLVEGSLHSTEDYIKALENLFSVPELETYLESYVLAGSFDYPGQIHGWNAVSASFNLTNIHQLSPLLQHIVPMIGPLHDSLNSHETVFKLNYSFFNKLNCFLYLKKRPLANKPKPYKINALLELTASGWNLIREEVLIKFHNCENPEARYLLDLLGNIIPLVLGFYPVIFRSGSWSAYREAMFHAWVLFYRDVCKNYNKVPLAFFSDVFYWFTTHHPMAHTIEQNIHLFNDYYVENFPSLCLQTNASNSAEQTI
ncbi:9604_t:CDS:1 [Entrophospora sp. SA101]|nr:12485_t:CDS:1 [Entrophospora sp. SA101]CAJ0837132.1 9604_t:CDS:1 [Entrophospora sp. SA101]